MVRSADRMRLPSYWNHWRSLGETGGNFRNADKSEGNRTTCAECYHLCIPPTILWRGGGDELQRTKFVVAQLPTVSGPLTSGRPDDPN